MQKHDGDENLGDVDELLKVWISVHEPSTDRAGSCCLKAEKGSGDNNSN